MEGWTSATAPCGPTSCRQVYIEEWAEVPGEAASPEARSYYTLRLLVRDDGLPYSLDEARYQADEPVEPHAMFVFDYSAPVAPITVPDTAPAD